MSFASIAPRLAAAHAEVLAEWIRLDYETDLCDCPCHFRGDPGQGYSVVYRDDRDITHEDWINCRCECSRFAYHPNHIRIAWAR